MLLFRSEEHVDRWRAAAGGAFGAVFPVEQAWELARAWFAGWLDPAWRRRTLEETEAVFASVGFTAPFWSLRPPPPADGGER